MSIRKEAEALCEEFTEDIKAIHQKEWLLEALQKLVLSTLRKKHGMAHVDTEVVNLTVDVWFTEICGHELQYLNLNKNVKGLFVTCKRCGKHTWDLTTWIDPEKEAVIGDVEKAGRAEHIDSSG